MLRLSGSFSQNRELGQLRIAHDPHRHGGHLPGAKKQPERLTRLTCSALTFAFCAVGSSQSATKAGRRMTGRELPVIWFCTMLEVGRRAGAKPSDRAEPDCRPMHRRFSDVFVFRVRRQAREAPRPSTAPKTDGPNFVSG
jgi:hypothetical protein